MNKARGNGCGERGAFTRGIGGFLLLTEKNMPALRKATWCAVLESIWAGAPLAVLAMVLAALTEGRPSAGALAGWAAALMLCGVLQAVCSVCAHVQSGIFSFALGEELRLRLGEHLRKIPLGILRGERAGKRVETLLLDVSNIENTLVYMYGKFMACLIPALLIGAGMVWVNASLGIVLVGTIPVAFLYLYVIRKYIDRRSEAMLRARREAAAGLIEYIHGITTIRSLNMTGKSFTGLDASLRALTKRSIEMEAGILPLVEFFGAVVSFGMVLLILLGSRKYLQGDIPLSTLLLFLVVSLRFYQPVTGIVGYFSLLRYLSRSVEHIRDVLEIPAQPPVAESPLPERPESREEYRALPDETGGPHNEPAWKHAFGVGPLDVRFEDVHFSYPRGAFAKREGGDGTEDGCAAREVLRGISFHLPAQGTFALAGPSGAGKSTVAGLLARFWDPDAGRIRIGGRDTAGVPPDVLLSGIGLVMQDTHLFTGSVAENLRLAKPEATDEELMAAAAAAHCDDVVRKLPQGLHTPLGDAGSRLSGGERRRLSVAAAILKDAPIVILDEATASLDPENEHRMQQAFEKLAENKTLLVIAHRLSTIAHADRILFLEDGRITEQGTYKELLEKGGRFAAFHTLQHRSGGWKILR